MVSCQPGLRYVKKGVQTESEWRETPAGAKAEAVGDGDNTKSHPEPEPR